MTRLRVILLIIFTCSVALLYSQTNNERLPNIVFILADDLGYGDVGAYGQQLIKTPNIDKLAKAGMRFTNFYAGSTVCAPSRASLMTGQHTGRAFIRGNGDLPLRPNDTIITEMLKQKGYVNGMVGKWGLGLYGTTGMPEKKGWDFFIGHLRHREGHYQRRDSVWKMVNGATTQIKIPNDVYINKLFTDAANDFIWQNRQRPFFLYVAYTLPHAELIAPVKYLQQYQDNNGNSLFAPETAHPDGLHYGAQPHPKAAYAAMITSMDDYIGSIVTQLKRCGLEENTIVIFSSDNGTHVEGGRKLQDAIDVFKSSGPLKGVKRDLYEGGIRVPFIIKWPAKVAANTATDHAAAFWDVLPTFASITGTTAPDNDGLSFLPTLLQQQQTPHEYLYWEFYEKGFKQAIRKANWKAIRFYKDGQPFKTELYNLAKDIGEKDDVAGAYPDKVKELEWLMDAAHRTSESKAFQVK